jgi:RhtB (resistance to homoserine/threonine) family protein
MGQYFNELIAVTSLFILVLITPGADFVLVVRNSLVYSRKVGVYSALGVALGILVHVSYSLVGLGFIISQSIVLFSILKFLGAAYLIYIGYKSLRAKKIEYAAQHGAVQHKELAPFTAIKIGFFTNVLNPKVTLLFLALFTQVIQQTTPVLVKTFYGLEMSVLVFIWYALVAVVISHERIKTPFAKVQHYIEKTTGLILIALGLKVALTRR